MEQRSGGVPPGFLPWFGACGASDVHQGGGDAHARSSNKTAVVVGASRAALAAALALGQAGLDVLVLDALPDPSAPQVHQGLIKGETLLDAHPQPRRKHTQCYNAPTTPRQMYGMYLS